MTFRIGQRVACITDRWDGPNDEPAPSVPVKDEIYTIDGIHDQQDGCFLSLAEISGAAWIYDGRGYGRFIFEANGFRPLTDIGVFTAILEQAPKREGVDA